MTSNLPLFTTIHFCKLSVFCKNNFWDCERLVLLAGYFCDYQEVVFNWSYNFSIFYVITSIIKWKSMIMKRYRTEYHSISITSCPSYSLNDCSSNGWVKTVIPLNAYMYMYPTRFKFMAPRFCMWYVCKVYTSMYNWKAWWKKGVRNFGQKWTLLKKSQISSVVLFRCVK